MKNNFAKSIILILLVLMIAFSIYKIVKTYAVFYSEKNAQIEGNIAKWKIKVNNTSVAGKSVQNFVIENLMVQTSENVLEGKFAPTLNGTFDIEICPEDTQVSIRYDIVLDLTSLEETEIKLASIEETLHSKELIRTGENTYTGIILLSDINNNYKDNIKLAFDWENDETKNNKDTSLGIVYNKILQVPIQVHFTQYLGETIEEFIQTTNNEEEENA